MTSTAPVLTLRDVGKRYVKYEDVPTLITGLLRWPTRGRRSKLWAVRHVDLEVERGEAVGVIGRNGAGKSTMLAMLAGVTAPTEGFVAVRGRVAPLLRLGVGFHEQLTGRENVYINGTILGLSQNEIDRKFDEIVQFAELEDFIDTPVKFYSSGMQARLGFSVAVASQPDVLLVDEILSVGDIAFQMRSFDRFLDLKREGATILVVSHNLEAVVRVCSRVLLLHEGKPHYLGAPSAAISKYHELMRLDWDTQSPIEEAHPASASQPIDLLAIDLINSAGSETLHFESGERLTVRLHVRFRRDLTDPAGGLFVYDEANQLIYAGHCVGMKTGRFVAGSEAEFKIDVNLPVRSGTYTLGTWMAWGSRDDYLSAPTQLFYVSGGPRRGLVNLGPKFDLRNLKPSARAL